MRRGKEGAREYVQHEKGEEEGEELGMMASEKEGGKGKKGVEWG